MALVKFSDLRETGHFVSGDMFGANAVFARTDEGDLTAAYINAAQALGVQNIRFGGGQADIAPDNPGADGEFPVDGVNSINIVEMVGGSLRPELVEFLEWCQASNAAGQPVQATLVIPTKHLSAAEYAGFADQIAAFTTSVISQYGDVIAAFQIGNEYWEMGETAYGIKASLAAEALNAGMLAAGLPEAEQPDILVQMATAGNEGSEFQKVEGVNDFSARNTAANLQIIKQLSEEARDAIDAVTEHYYYNKSGLAFVEGSSGVNHINKDYAIWSKEFDKELDLIITEWNVRTTATSQHGMASASTIIQSFENMIDLGVDGAHIWAIDYHSRTALTLDTDGGVRLDDQGRLLNSPQGAVFDLMSEALIGKQLLSTSFSSGMPGVEFAAYASDSEMVIYISSRSFDQLDIILDLSNQVPLGASVDAVKVSIDQATSNGLQWEQGEAADSIIVDGEAYFYNEHDVDVILTDMVFNDVSDIDLMLNPFEVVQLTIDLTDGSGASLGETSPDATQSVTGTAGNDMITWKDKLTVVNAADGIDTFAVQATRAASTLTLDSSGKSVFATKDGKSTVALNSVERIKFQDGTLALDIDGNSGQAYRLYQASFDRTPDASGLEFWINQLDLGNVSLVQAAENFLRSAEFSSAYGDNRTLTDAEFVDLLYRNVLDRPADQSGYDFWLAQTAEGLSRQEVLVFFSESEENKKNVAPAIDDGIWIS